MAKYYYARKFYTSTAWVEFRQRLIIKRGAICKECGQLVHDTSNLVGHHKIKITPENINDPAITLNEDNVDLVCLTCHNKEHGRFGYSREHHVYLVYGSPCSGKKTMVKQLAERGDLIIDMDRIFSCISGCALYNKPDELKFNAFRVRDTLIDMVRTRYGKWGDAYVIGGYPNKSERERLALSLGAELIYCASTEIECLERSKARGVFANDWVQYVKKWWAEYQE